MVKHDGNFGLEQWVKGVIISIIGGAENNLGDAKYGANTLMIKF